MNHFFKVGNKLIKYVNLNKAILWKTREISMAMSDYKKLDNDEIEKIIFKDRAKNLSIVFKKKTFMEKAVLKIMHQEMQFYIGVDYGRKEKG